MSLKPKNWWKSIKETDKKKSQFANSDRVYKEKHQKLTWILQSFREQYSDHKLVYSKKYNGFISYRLEAWSEVTPTLRFYDVKSLFHNSSGRGVKDRIFTVHGEVRMRIEKTFHIIDFIGDWDNVSKGIGSVAMIATEKLAHSHGCTRITGKISTYDYYDEHRPEHGARMKYFYEKFGFDFRAPSEDQRSDGWIEKTLK